MFRVCLRSVVALLISWIHGASAAESGILVASAKPAAPKNLTIWNGPPPTQMVLAFVDEVTQDRHAALLAEWAAEVSKEGVFRVEWVRKPRVATWTSSNRVPSMQAILTEVQQRKPAAVMLWGALGWIATGSFNPDGHGPRVAWSDVPFASDHTVWTDTLDFQITHNVAWSKNLPSDGRWDQTFDIVAAIKAKRSVGRVDFSNLQSGNPSVHADEHTAMEDYLRRNLAYRRGAGFDNEVLFVGSLLSPSTKLWLQESIEGRTVRDLGAVTQGQPYPGAGRRVFGMYTSVVSYLRDGFKDASGTMMSTLWTVLYKSWGAEPWNVAETSRQYLRQSLVVTFGGRHWLPNGATVHDAYLRHSYPGLGCLTSQDTLLGDVTLKLR